jgi:SAM-dependent methyltransferase
MYEYWESRFKNEGAMWEYEPSDSAFITIALFKSENLEKILIPGFGYGRNGKLFIDNGFKVTGIEISLSAIDLARRNNLDCLIHHGSVTSMPFDNEKFDGIYCYALVHILNFRERREFLKSCYDQLREGGIMVFTVASKQSDMYGKGKCIGRDRYELSKGLKVFFYDNESVKKEFSYFDLVEYKDVNEPVKFLAGHEPVKLILIFCRKTIVIPGSIN